MRRSPLTARGWGIDPNSIGVLGFSADGECPAKGTWLRDEDYESYLRLKHP
jgi:hypothetical protein